MVLPSREQLGGLEETEELQRFRGTVHEPAVASGNHQIERLGRGAFAAVSTSSIMGRLFATKGDVRDCYVITAKMKKGWEGRLHLDLCIL